ncbi:Transmembrane protein 63A [Fasciola hepatica]|uniref:Transmembrane protein 63A n=1 Tax=Fasciola hepatica TaxID=6192 RepID=A0A4E0R586_FASHE|nr:Transmembrane protein 63A [Fasciola hepatica]
MTFMLFAIILLQLNLFMFIALRLGPVGCPLSVVAICGLVIPTLMWLTTIVTGWVFFGSAANRHRFPPGSHHQMLATSSWTAVAPRPEGLAISATNVVEPFRVDQYHYSVRSSDPVAQQPTHAAYRQGANPSGSVVAADAREEAALAEVSYSQSANFETGLTLAVSSHGSQIVHSAFNSMSESGNQPNSLPVFIAPVLMHSVNQGCPSVTTSITATEPQ